MLGYKDERANPIPRVLKNASQSVERRVQPCGAALQPKGQPRRPGGQHGARQRPGSSGSGIHDLRHSHISLLIDMGFTALAIADRVGHESIDITYRYAHLFPPRQAEKAREHPWRTLARGGR